MKRISLFFILLSLIALACGRSGGTEPRKLNMYPTPTSNSTQTPFVQYVTTTPQNTTTPVILLVVQTSTPLTTKKCVIVDNVYLRPSPNIDNYPVAPLPKGATVILSGATNDNWVFASYDKKSGWVNSEFLGSCN